MFYDSACNLTTVKHAKTGIIFLCIGDTQWCIYNTQSKSDKLFDTQSSVLQADWLILENNEKRR